MFQHFIITAFNIDLGLKPRTTILDIDYLIKRFSLFENICFPSVVGQTNQNFKWLVFFDRDMDSQFQEKVQKLSQYKNFIPIYTPPNCCDYKVFSNAVRGQLLVDTEYVITSNLDNDDALSKSFIQLVQKHYQRQDFEFINFAFGLILCKHGILLREYLSSPFLSLIEKKEEVLTCRVINHYDLSKLADKGLPVSQIATYPTWLQIVQGSNIRNNLDINASIVGIKTLTQNFALELSKIEEYIPKRYQQYIFQYLKNFIIKNKYNLPFTKRIRNCLNIINPWFSIAYLSVRLKKQDLSQNKKSSEAAKQLCKANPFLQKI